MAIHRFVWILFAGFYDVVVLQRDLLPIGVLSAERLLKMINHRLVLDFDDAIYKNYQSPSNRLSKMLWNSDKIGQLCSMCERVVVGNEFLREWASRWNQEVKVIPTCVRLDEYQERQYPDFEGARCSSPRPVVIGWIGTPLNIPYLKTLFPVFKQLAKMRPDGFELRIVADGKPLAADDFPMTFRRWTLSDEANEIVAFDVGVMPLPDNEWTRSKCGGKLLQYGASALPVVASPVGVNRTIIQHGDNGLLANSEIEWLEALKELMSNPELRKRLGNRLRQTIAEQYNIEHWGEVWADLLRQVAWT